MLRTTTHIGYWMTCGDECDREHLVTEAAVVARRKTGTVTIEAVCGHAVVMSPMTVEPGRACLACLTPATPTSAQWTPTVPDQRGPHRHRSPGRLHRALHRDTTAAP
jgi:hypothetical protein